MFWKYTLLFHVLRLPLPPLFHVLGLPLHPLFHVQERERERKRMTINVYFDLIKLNYFIGMFTQKKYIPHLNFLVYTQPLKSGIYSLTNKK
jgi:hypothetical protein